MPSGSDRASNAIFSVLGHLSENVLTGIDIGGLLHCLIQRITQAHMMLLLSVFRGGLAVRVVGGIAPQFATDLWGPLGWTGLEELHCQVAPRL